MEYEIPVFIDYPYGKFTTWNIEFLYLKCENQGHYSYMKYKFSMFHI